MPKFFTTTQDFKNNEVILKDENYNHLVNVLRVTKSEKIEVTNSDTNTSYDCSIIEIDKQNKQIVLEIENQKESKELKNKIYIIQSLPKQDKMELIIEKCVELGAFEVIPLKTKYCVTKLDTDTKKQKKIIKWNNVAYAAAKQSRRDIIPKVTDIYSIKSNEFKNLCAKLDCLIILNENEKSTTLKECIKNIKQNKNEKENENENKKNLDLKIGVVIGPEGGFSKEEIEILEQLKGISVTLGKRILRTETAPIYALSIIGYEIEE